MSQENPEKTFSLHRYLDENGVPDYDRIFSIIESPLKRHLNVWLLGHLDSQPEIIRENQHINKHLLECGECRQKLRPKKI